MSAPTHAPRAAVALAILFGAILLTWPALLNRYPLIYPDSISYIGDGRGIARALFLHRPGVSAMRSEFYSLGIFPFHWNLSPWPIVAWQALLTSWVLWLVLRSILPRRTKEGDKHVRRFIATFLTMVALLSLLTSVSWYVSLPMPDLLGSLLYLALYLLIFARTTLSRAERWGLSLLAIWAITAHSTHLMLAVGLCLLLTVLLLWPRNWFPRGRRLRPASSLTGLVQVALLIAAAVAAQLSLHAYLYGRATLNGNHPPYLMARIVADGPGALYLQQNCAHLNWAICASVGHLPDNDDDFLWSDGGVWAGADAHTQQRLLAEEMPLVLATLRAYPLQQAGRSWANFIHQLNDFGVNDFDNNDWMQQALAQVIPSSAIHYPRTLQARSVVPTNAFTILQRWVVFPSAVLLAALLPRLWRGHRVRLLGLIAIVAPMLHRQRLPHRRALQQRLPLPGPRDLAGPPAGRVGGDGPVWAAEIWPRTPSSRPGRSSPLSSTRSQCRSPPIPAGARPRPAAASTPGSPAATPAHSKAGTAAVARLLPSRRAGRARCSAGATRSCAAARTRWPQLSPTDNAPPPAG